MSATSTIPHKLTCIQAPATLVGRVAAIASKSVAHRALLCAAFADGPTELVCNTTSQDIEATKSCIEALGAQVQTTEKGFLVRPVPAAKLDTPTQPTKLDCKESGSTLRFVLPVVCALGRTSELTGAGRLAARPLTPLYEELLKAGITLSEQGSFPLKVAGALQSFDFELAGNISSQYISGLLLAAPLMNHEVTVCVTHPIESAPYIDITLQVLQNFGISIDTSTSAEATTYHVAPQKLCSPGTFIVEGDWSNAAFWLCAAALLPEGQDFCVSNLSLSSTQGDKNILAYLEQFGARFTHTSTGATSVLRCCSSRLHAATINVEACPDLVPPLAVVAACAPGTTRIEGASRLRLKESDRIQTVAACLKALGVHVVEGSDFLEIEGADVLLGGTVNAANDHRIAMMAGIAALRAQGQVEVCGSECVAKSYPAFFDTLAQLGASLTTTEV